MIRLLTTILALAVWTSQVPASEPIKPEAFRAWFEAGSRGRLLVPARVESHAREFRYVFVSGFWNEQMPGYFAQNVKGLVAHGVPRGHIYRIEPSSHRTLEENAAEVRDRFLEIAREGDGRLVVIAHSRGACDALAFALGNPEFVRDHVEALFLIQGPFGGTAAADYLAGIGTPMDRRMAVRHRIVVHLLRGLESLRLADGKHGGLADLSRPASRSYWRELLRQQAQAIPIVGPRTYFVTSTARPSQLPIFQRAIGWYLATYYGRGDGIVVHSDQSLEGLGTVLSLGNAGHSDLTSRFPSARPQRRLRSALVGAILMTIGNTRVSEDTLSRAERWNRGKRERDAAAFVRSRNNPRHSERAPL
jgi:pimeloyl-ACP methyl ester carboxylesterase